MASIHSKTTKTGTTVHYVVVAFGGKRKWIKAGSLVDAKKMKKGVEALEDSQRIEKLGLTIRTVRIDDFFQQYLEHVRLHCSENTLKRYKASLNAFLAFLRLFHSSIKQLSQIKPDTIEDFQRRRLESVEIKTEADGTKNGNHLHKRLPLPQTVNYEISILRSAFLWAHDRELIPSVPTKKVKDLKPKILKQARLLSEDECLSLLKAAEHIAKSEPYFRGHALAFRFLLNSGLRSGELCNLTWNDVDLKSGLIKIQPKADWAPKTFSREFFLNDACLQILKKLSVKVEKSEYVFVDSQGVRLRGDDLRKALIKAAKFAGIDGLTRVHDLRHTFNSLMQMNGVDPATMGKILGHKDIETTMIYTHQTAEHLKKSIEKVGI